MWFKGNVEKIIFPWIRYHRWSLRRSYSNLFFLLIAAVNEEIFATIFRMKNVLLYYSIPEVAATI